MSGLQDAAASCKPRHVEQAIRSAIKTSVASSWHFISTYIEKSKIKGNLGSKEDLWRIICSIHNGAKVT